MARRIRRKVWRAFGWLPDQVKRMEMEDYVDALLEIGEIPCVDEVFYRGFFRPTTPTKHFPMRNALERKVSVNRMIQEIQISG